MEQVITCPQCQGRTTSYRAPADGRWETIYQCLGGCTQTVLYQENYQVVFEFILRGGLAIAVSSPSG